jgi:hypothetical protein
MGFIEFPELSTRRPCRLAPRFATFVLFPRCTPAPRSLHHLRLCLLTPMTHLSSVSPPVSRRRHRMTACHRVHAFTCPSRRCLPAMCFSCLARHYALASQGPLGHSCRHPGGTSLARCLSWIPLGARFRALIGSSRPQGTSVGSGPACQPSPSEDGHCWLPACSLGLC